MPKNIKKEKINRVIINSFPELYFPIGKNQSIKEGYIIFTNKTKDIIKNAAAMVNNAHLLFELKKTKLKNPEIINTGNEVIKNNPNISQPFVHPVKIQIEIINDNMEIAANK